MESPVLITFEEISIEVGICCCKVSVKAGTVGRQPIQYIRQLTPKFTKQCSLLIICFAGQSEEH